MRDINDQIADYRGLVESLAHKFVGRNEAEFDDLVQEGLISVWEALRRGNIPSATVIEHAMQYWVRRLGAQIGRGRYVEPDDYPEIVSLDEVVGSDEGVALERHDVISRDPIPLPGHDPLA